jgi:hypothetical protein
MTVEQMHLAVKLGLDKTEGLTYPAFEREELDFWINEATDRYVKTRYSGNNVKGESFEQSQKRTDDLRTLVTEVAITPSSHSSFVSNAWLASLPEDYMFLLNDVAHLHWTGGIEYTTSSIPCTSDTLITKINDPFSEHITHLNTARPLRVITADGIELITDGQYTINTYSIKYLRRPARVNYALTAVVVSGGVVEGINYQVSGNTVGYNGHTYNIGEVFTGVIGITTFTGAGVVTAVTTACDLPEHAHREIVLLTVKILTENIESPRYQTQSVEITQNE